MDDPDVAWPAWKFGMKRDALFTTLHDQYNTFQSTIQDPDAFHHDVYEIANEAATTVEFHNLLAVRRDQRLRELNESLESASFEIIANPALVGTTQWEYALQLFRTRSLDSLVRYFASYLPSSHPWHTPAEAENEPSIAVSTSTKPFFDDAILTHEPMEMTHSLSHASLRHDLPPSPRSLTTYSDDMESQQAHELYCLNTLTPARTLSLSDSDQGDDRRYHHENNVVEDEQILGRKADITTGGVDEECPSQYDDTSQSSGPDTPVSMSDAEPDVAEDEPSHPHNHHGNHPTISTAYATTLQEFTAASTTPKTLTPPTPIPSPIDATNKIDVGANNDANNNNNDNNATAAADTSISTTPRSSPRRRPLQSGYAVDDVSRTCSPLPVSVRVRHRSVSPSRAWPLAHVESGHHHPAAPSGIIANHDHTRASDRSSRRGRRHHRLETVTASITRSVSISGLGRRRPGLGVEKTVLPRPMRTRQRERREAAASAAVGDQQRQ
ncbi:hypothetical protein SCUCBS95973_000717 [Sporothrix curviconia]|uniref:Uncharacterized protein n=1 Tax=Sporothrix curviconia TaxID=1260050 RepID=A0ABP0ASM0_9PEZI